MFQGLVYPRRWRPTESAVWAIHPVSEYKPPASSILRRTPLNLALRFGNDLWSAVSREGDNQSSPLKSGLALSFLMGQSCRRGQSRLRFAKNNYCTGSNTSVAASYALLSRDVTFIGS